MLEHKLTEGMAVLDAGVLRDDMEHQRGTVITTLVRAAATSPEFNSNDAAAVAALAQIPASAPLSTVLAALAQAAAPLELRLIEPKQPRLAAINRNPEQLESFFRMLFASTSRRILAGSMPRFENLSPRDAWDAQGSTPLPTVVGPHQVPYDDPEIANAEAENGIFADASVGLAGVPASADATVLAPDPDDKPYDRAVQARAEIETALAAARRLVLRHAAWCPELTGVAAQLEAVATAAASAVHENVLVPAATAETVADVERALRHALQDDRAQIPRRVVYVLTALIAELMGAPPATANKDDARFERTKKALRRYDDQRDLLFDMLRD